MRPKSPVVCLHYGNFIHTILRYNNYSRFRFRPRHDLRRDVNNSTRPPSHAAISG